MHGARGWPAGSGPLSVLASPLGLLPALASLAVRVAGYPARVSLPFAIPCSLCVPRARSGCPSGPRRVSVACVCARAPAAYALSPPPGRCGARTTRGLLQCAGRAIPGGSCPSACPASVPCSAYLALWGLARSLRPLALLWVTRPPAGRPAFVSWLCALWGQHERAQGGRLSPGCGAPGWALPHARPSVLEACGRGSLPTGCGCGGCGRGDLSPTPQRALLRAGFERCGGSKRAPGGGACCLGVGRPGLGAHPRPTARPWGVRPGPTTHRLWVRGGWA